MSETEHNGRQAPTGRMETVRSGDEAASPDLRPGDLLAGRYRIGALLGRGGMGAVYEAVDRELGIPVALKTLLPETAGDVAALRALKREVLLARQVTHPNVCRLYDLGRDEGRGLLFATMELLRGETLSERLARLGRLAVEEALGLAAQMVEGLEAAHAAGVVHRDFKSGNVMLTAGNGRTRVALTDFGLARPALREAASAQEGRVDGTPAYMAPEQLRGEAVGPAADIYALGVVLHEMVTGRLPFEGEDRWRGALRKLAEDAPSPRRFVPDLPRAWEEGIGRCLARPPRQRPARAIDLLAILEVGARAARRPKGNLPPARDSFVGRREEMKEIARRLEGGTRLLTLLGTGGAGKTRLALEVGRAGLDDWPGGVWFCDLTEARSRDGVVSAVATALGVPLGREDPVVQLGHAVAGRGRCLLLLDNAEQVTAAVGEALGAWLRRAPEAAFVVTSRERLGLEEEEGLAVEALGEEASVALFVDRARGHRPGFEAGEGEREEIERLVRGLEGLPLAVELAAARVRVMIPRQIAERLSDRFRLLSGGKGPGRHAALRAAIDTSWELLEPWEKAAFRQASVFEGGFTLEAAEAVLDLAALPEAPWVVDVVQALLDKSLLRLLPAGSGEPRFGMYVSLQEYARERLGEEGPGGAEERHGRFYARFGTDEAIEGLDRHGGVERRRRLGLELENLVAACRRAAGRGDGEVAAAAFCAAAAVLELRGPFAAGVNLGREVLGMEALSPAQRGRAARQVGRLLRSSGGTEEAREHCERALEIARGIGNRRSEGVLLGDLGILQLLQGRIEEAREQFERALEIHREVGDRRAEGNALGNLGLLYADQGRMEEAREHDERALKIAREVGCHRLEGAVLGNLGVLHREEGRMEEAREQFERALEIAREVGNRHSEGIGLGNLGILHWTQGRMEEAREHDERALKIAREVGDRGLEGAVLGFLGALDARVGRAAQAQEAFAAGERLVREVGDPLELGKLLCARGEAEAGWGDLEAARAALEEASSLAEATGAGADSELGKALARLRDAIGEEGRR